jgi:hypothetical protein
MNKGETSHEGQWLARYEKLMHGPCPGCGGKLWNDDGGQGRWAICERVLVRDALDGTAV